MSYYLKESIKGCIKLSIKYIIASRNLKSKTIYGLVEKYSLLMLLKLGKPVRPDHKNKYQGCGTVPNCSRAVDSK